MDNQNNLLFTLGRIDLPDDFTGPWQLYAKRDVQERVAIKVKGNREADVLNDIMNAPLGTFPSTIFPDTAHGADVIMLAKNSSNKWLLICLQAKAKFQASTPEALRVLQSAYAQNRVETGKTGQGTKKAKVVDQEALDKFDALKAECKVVHLVAKLNGSIDNITKLVDGVVQVIIDEKKWTSVDELKPLQEGMKRLRKYNAVKD